MEEKVVFEFNIVELNTVVKALKKLPYEESAQLIQSIIKTYETQLMEKEKEAKAKKPSK